MKFKDFDKFTEDFFDSVRRMRDTKGKEYARTADRFDNFNRLATELALSREKVWQVYFTKHWDAIRSYIDNKREFSEEGIHGRMIDAVTYLILLAGMFKENASGTKRVSKADAEHGSIPRKRRMGRRVVHDARPRRRKRRTLQQTEKGNA